MAKSVCLIALFLGLSFAGAHAEVRLPAILSDHMILQRSPATRVWGTAAPGEHVVVSLAGRNAETVADAGEKWLVALNLKDATPGPFAMTVKGQNTITVSDVAVGEVWLASGQSNMDMSLGATKDAALEVARPANPQLRRFFVQRNAANVPAGDCEGKWVLAGPETIRNFSAVGYYFIKSLNDELKVPVGLVQSTWGGTPVESWTRLDALKSQPELAEGCERAEQAIAAYPTRMTAYRKFYPEWLKETSREDRPQGAPETFAAVGVNLKDWTPVHLPGEISAAALPAMGVIWLRRNISLPADTSGKPLNVGLEVIRGFESVYWNGEKIGENTPLTLSGDGERRTYVVPERLVREGTNTLAVRIFAPEKTPSITGYALAMKAGPVFLEGSWMAKAEYALPSLEAGAAPAPKLPAIKRQPQWMPAYLFNGMIAPLVSYSIRGAIWYQGENNVERAWQYRTAFPLMIADWRNQWKQGDFPFYFCQLANFLPKKETPEESRWAELRESQSEGLRLPNTGQALLLDIGESADIHPRNKQDVGERLARIALARDYGKAIAFSGPVYQKMKIENGAIWLDFTHTEGGLIARQLPAVYDVCSAKGETLPLIRNSLQSQLEGFAICGADRRWVWANAKVEGSAVRVWSEKIPAPVAVRYGWADNPTCNLYNGAGLPAAPFRTDDFPAASANAKF